MFKKLLASALLFAGFGSSFPTFELGDLKSTKKAVWVYVSGLTNGPDTLSEKKNRQLLDAVARVQGSKVIAVAPPKRSKKQGNQYYWPHATSLQTAATYRYIQDQITQLNKNYSIAGFIGFSHGGSFLTRLAQEHELRVPVVSFAGSSEFLNRRTPSNLILVVGKKDIHHQKPVKALYDKLQETPMHVELYEHDNGHELDKKILTNIFEKKCSFA